MKVNEDYMFLKSWDGLTKYLREIRKELIKKNNQEKIIKIIKMLKIAKKRDKQIILLGVGRNGQILKMFSTRLIQLGYGRGQIKILSETGPSSVIALTKSLVICVSGRGFTSPPVDIAKALQEAGSELVFITSNENSELYKKKIADVTVLLKGLSDYEFNLSRYAYGPDQPVRFDSSKFHFPPTLFEIATLFLLESIISSLHSIFPK